MSKVFLNPIIVAIDKNSETEAYQLSKELIGNIGAIKLGLEYFDTFGPDGIKKIQSLGIPIFLDLKIHDIPQTVKKTIDTLSSLRPAILNIHALGGKNMMELTSDSLANQKKVNYALREDMTKQEFINEVTKGLSSPPKYFPSNVELNKEGYEDVPTTLSNPTLANLEIASSSFPLVETIIIFWLISVYYF